MWMLVMVVLGGKKKEDLWTTTMGLMMTAVVARVCSKPWRSRAFCFSSLVLLVIAVTVLRSVQLLWQPTMTTMTTMTTTTAVAVLKSSKEVEAMAHHDQVLVREQEEETLGLKKKKKKELFATTSDNRTLLAFSAIDPMQEQEWEQAKQLLDGSLEEDSAGYRRSSYDTSSVRFLSKGNHFRSGSKDHYYYQHHDLEERRKLSSSRWRGNPEWRALRASPKYIPFWPRFRLLVNTWVTTKQRFEPKVMQRLLSTVKDPIDNGDAAKSRGRRYHTCAVVGNSGILLNRSYGAIIDEHEMVMRLNNARTMGFERFVGKKTTIAFINSNILHQCSRRFQCFCHPHGTNVPIVMYVCQLIHLMDVAVCSSTHTSPLIVTDPRFDCLTARIVKWYSAKDFVEKTGRPLNEWSDAHEGSTFHYSSGLQAVMLALGICDEVNLFGFGKFNGTKHHYHTSQKKELPLHDYEAEYIFYDDLVNRRLEAIPFLKEAGIEIPTVHIFR
jgi:low affinity Fe/Cu permease